MHKIASAVSGTKSEKKGKKMSKYTKGFLGWCHREGANGAGMQFYPFSFHCMGSFKERP